jgi:hypothetical protein
MGMLDFRHFTNRAAELIPSIMLLLPPPLFAPRSSYMVASTRPMLSTHCRCLVVSWLYLLVSICLISLDRIQTDTS